MSDESTQGEKKKRRRRRSRRSPADGESQPKAAGSASQTREKGQKRKQAPRPRTNQSSGSKPAVSKPASGFKARGPEEKQKSPPKPEADPFPKSLVSEPNLRFGDDGDAPEISDPMSFGSEEPGIPSYGGDTGVPQNLAREVIGVRFSRFGRVERCDSKGRNVSKGDQVVVKSSRGQRFATVAVGPKKVPNSSRSRCFLLRPANALDLEQVERDEESGSEALKLAREQSKRLKLPIKIFRHESVGSKIVLYFASENSVDTRPLSRALDKEFSCRVELRQTGVREEARAVGGIGSCGMELCCSTWLPSFAPVSIKHAKDQGLSLNSSKITGQCGRLKCCLVYEHATYAEMRKGLPKLGKRVVTEEGEGRIIEVDVLRQRLRVRGQGGQSKTYAPDEVTPLFPSQGQPGSNKAGASRSKSKTSRKNEPKPQDPKSS